MSKPIFVLAPMDDVTDTVFRQIVADCAQPDMFFTEFVNVDGLQSAGRQNLLKKMRFSPSETSLTVQIWGLEPENFEKTAKEIADGTFARELGLPEGKNYNSIDLNMGCPAKSEVKNGTCSALINNRPLASQIIKATQQGAGKLPVSVKTRLGWNSVDLSWIEFLLEHKLDMLTIHFRTRKEMSKVPAHWEYAAEVVKMRDKISPSTRIIGNGDVLTREQGESLAKKYKIDGIMIGRGVFHDPYVFSASSPWSNMSREAKIELFKKHLSLFKSTWKNGERKFEPLKKFAKIYINDFVGAKELREEIMACHSVEEVLEVL